ncbi:DNA repair ATPase [Flavilitoribacter nigricans]|uniref:Uncharacterized protein n=1 Tax=Flavilitoribacter nigricans (strain ATCC 23147 / DSM 23189 / NBRC 102662 / NCIMB 1420 / SS-2) TaxID=1122177 RepID=A0A2D0N0L6_FLAN2|nr:DNA repair ATPase [Flavilitoribacter nigricans]PHN02035.1 hypothetical protein CRP01_33915 [Flavilitoribacter nigricans DSM 23189 = NBRC 102662]
MENTQSKVQSSTPEKQHSLEAGTYEIIRNRLQQQSDKLELRLEQLNALRKETFGTVEPQLLANERLNTGNFCIARDMFALGQYCIFGYNVHIGLRSGIQLADVFNVYRLEGNTFREAGLELLKHEKFEIDFQNLYRYYKDAFFVRFVRQGSYLYMTFQVSNNAGDIKAFKWLIRENDLQYVDARSEHEIRAVQQFEFRWKRIDRDQHRKGLHPHVSVLDRVFVETVGGDLTIKVEDNTEDGRGIYREEVLHQDQTLDDAEYLYADLGNLIVLKIRPYQEGFRYFVFNEKMQEVQRIDALADSGVLLPDGQGLIFSNGYYLQTGEYKLFESVGRGWKFESRINAPNGEDYLYSFYNQAAGQSILMAYNVITQAVETPIRCHGFAIFADGTMGYFRSEEEATKHHMIQLWQTPFGSNPVLAREHTDSYLSKLGNKEIVKAMAECREILSLTHKEDSYADLYADLVSRCTDVLDSYYWINHQETFRLGEVLQELRDTAKTAIDEYEKKLSIQRTTQSAIERVRAQALDLFRQIGQENFESVDVFVYALSELRRLKGAIVSLEELRYTDKEFIAEMMERADQYQEDLSGQCIRFLLSDTALLPYQERINQHRDELEKITSALDGKALEEAIEKTAQELQLLIEIVNNLHITDANDSTRIIDQISALFATLNQLKGGIQKKHRELAGTEAQSAFRAQIKLLDQSTINFLDLAKTGKQCDDYLTKLLVQVEELEGQFAEYDRFIPILSEKREEIYIAFDSRRKAIAEALHKRTDQLQLAAERILKGVSSRLQNFRDAEAINGFFASDIMIEKVRDIIRQLQELEDSNKAAALQTQLKSLREEAVRQLRDRQDLYLDGENIIKLGQHHFDVNVQPLDLSIIERRGALYYHLTGTDFYELIEDAELNELQEVWSQELISEDAGVYRAEYLAYRVFQQWLRLEDRQNADLEALVKEAVNQRYNEGYTKGIHDQDALLILDELVKLYETIDLLRYPSDIRAFAYLLWHHALTEADRQLLQTQLRGAGTLLRVFPNGSTFDYLREEIQEALSKQVE